MKTAPENTGEVAGGGEPPPSALDRWVRMFTGSLAALGAGVVLLMMLVVAYSVINRYVLGTPVTWSDEFSGYLVVALVMLGAAETLRTGDHISVDLLTNKLSDSGRRHAAAIGNVMVLAVSAALLVSGVETINYSYHFGMLSEGYLEVPMWIPQSFLILGSVSLALVALANLMQLYRPGRDH